MAEISFGFIDRRVMAAVERVAGSDPDPGDPFRGLYISDEVALRLTQGDSVSDADARLNHVVAQLGLDLLEAAVLAVCAATELNPRYGRLYAYLQDDVTRKLPSPRLVGQLLEGEGLSPADVMGAFDTTGRLRHLGALKLLGDAQTPLAERPVKVADRLAAVLLGGRMDESPSPTRLRMVNHPVHDPGRTQAVETMAALLARPSTLPVVLAGPDADTLIAKAYGRQLVAVHVKDLSDRDVMAEAALVSALEDRPVIFEGLEDIEPADRGRLLRVIETRPERTILAAPTRTAALALGERTVLLVEAPSPSFAERTQAWADLTGTAETADVAAKFRLSMTQIVEASEVARLSATARGADTPEPADLDLGARQASSSRLGELAARLPPGFKWEDLVVPERQKELLQSISAYLRHRDRVLSDWGYEKTVARTQGLKVLFAGESGTGKTMAAQVMAAELGLEIFRVDLATTVSKYIGETEKNLDRIFGAAEGSNAILFFDEADALFGKRSEVGDSHDRYANIEVAYLLQKMEGYPGAVILATNFRRNIDDAFVRRLDFVIDFPFPEPEDRKRIWERVLPDEAPRADDVDLDFLSEKFKLSGGAIRNCSLAAAFQAADDDTGAISMRHLVRAVAQEYGKQGRLTLEADFERFHDVIRVGGGRSNGH
ncbi:ATP-binding protein [Solirubrobacter ginsenosidimutans]|uniref:ATP-binding protein n=1 Tax=Solirubrobacter ginsenosidimutans TaxID=490573 RepID=A0A9X3N1R0_9ACTN|nr:ATP-binding protein [Solirubrobacter ginsenosidimutans]MDA0166647.1 ATP-binding protein [Solirubrobacter ginsenosidimutans]